MELNGYKGFAVLESDRSIEATMLIDFAEETGTPLRIIKHEDEAVPTQYIPVGSISWIQKILGKELVPDYYPTWCQDHFHRHIWLSDLVPTNGLVFVKSAAKYESLIGSTAVNDSATIVDKWSSKNKARCWCSDKVEFINAYRYYVTNGKVVTSGQVAGSATGKIPELKIDIQKKWCGALDFGTLSTGEFALVEASYPVACGITGTTSKDDFKDYLRWLVLGWEYIKNI